MKSSIRKGKDALVVRKFGGTSVGGAQAIARVARILGTAPCLVVLSAMASVTESLIGAVEAAARGESEAVEAQMEALLALHLDTARALVSTPVARRDLERTLEKIIGDVRPLLSGVLLLGEASPRSVDAVTSIGERLSTAIVIAYLRSLGVSVVHADARRWLRTDDLFGQARPRIDALPELASPLAQSCRDGAIVVTEGFIGSTAQGLTTTLGRGGSDYTAALLGAAVDAGVIEIWTDVTGVLTADPRVVPAARPVPRLTYREAAELAYFGAKVLHPATVRPAVERGIPVIVKNSLRPDDGGTTIDMAGDPSRAVKAITSKRHVVSVTIESDRMLGAHGFLKSVFETCDRHAISVDVVATAEVSVTFTLDPHPALARCVDELGRLGTVTVTPARAMISIIGEGIKTTAGIGERVFSALRTINVELISMGASRLNLSLLLAQADMGAALAAIHGVLFEDRGARAGTVQRTRQGPQPRAGAGAPCPPRRATSSRVGPQPRAGAGAPSGAVSAGARGSREAQEVES